MRPALLAVTENRMGRRRCSQHAIRVAATCLTIVFAATASAQTFRLGNQPYRFVDDAPGTAYTRQAPTLNAYDRPIPSGDDQIGSMAGELDQQLKMSYRHDLPEYNRRYVHFRAAMEHSSPASRAWTRSARCRRRASAAERAAQAENLRKMLLAMVDDIRVVLIKLAERTQALRFLMTGGPETPASRQRAAREVLDLFAPLANRLGVWQLKWELEDLACARSSPRPTRRSRRCWTSAGSTAQRYIEDVIAALKRELAAAGIRAEVTGRPKHIYSIWNKMRRKQSGIDALYDIRAVRILVDDVKDCYTALGIVHHLWTPLPRRVRRLHREAEGQQLPFAAHGGDRPRGQAARGADPHARDAPALGVRRRRALALQGRARRRACAAIPRFDDRIAWLRQVLDWKDAVADASEWLAAFKSSLFTDTIYVLTPQGKVVDLPRGATPVDFAYAVHTSLGHRCRGARVDGAMVPLNHVAEERPARRDRRGQAGWARRATGSTPELGYAHSHRARSQGAAVVQGAAARGNAGPGPRDRRARTAARRRDGGESRRGGGARRDSPRPRSSTSPSGARELNMRQIQTAIRAVAQPAAAPKPRPTPADVLARQSRAAGAGSGILVVGVDRLMTNLARCCKPAPPDGIVGFVTRGKGVTIHRQRCSNVARMRASRARAPDRRRLGQAARRGVSRRRRARGDGPAGPAARHHRNLLARADQRHGGEHADAQQRDADGVHARGGKPRRARPRARARRDVKGVLSARAALAPSRLRTGRSP